MTLQRVCFACNIWLAVVLLHLSIGHTVRWRRCGHSSRDNFLLIIGVCHLTNVRTYSHSTCPRISNNALTNVQNLHPPPFLRFILSNNIAVHCILRGEYPNSCIYALNNISAPHSYKLSTPLPTHKSLCNSSDWALTHAVASYMEGIAMHTKCTI